MTLYLYIHKDKWSDTARLAIDRDKYVKKYFQQKFYFMKTISAPWIVGAKNREQ